MDRFGDNWLNIATTTSASYVCGYCGSSISSDKAYVSRTPGYAIDHPRIYICHVCSKPTFIYNGITTPAAPLGNPVQKLPADIMALYEEIRSSTSVNAFTAAVLAARKLLMHIAVEKGAPTNKKFIEYVNYLDTNHYTPPNSRGWVDKIRKLGNDANHEIVIMNSDQAKLILTFLEMILKFIYEFPDIEEPPEVQA
jgi:hypothetical protein